MKTFHSNIWFKEQAIHLLTRNKNSLQGKNHFKKQLIHIIQIVFMITIFFQWSIRILSILLNKANHSRINFCCHSFIHYVFSLKTHYNFYKYQQQVFFNRSVHFWFGWWIPKDVIHQYLESGKKRWHDLWRKMNFTWHVMPILL